MENNLIITTEQGFDIIRIISKLGMKEPLVDGIKKFMEYDQQYKTTMRQLRNKLIKNCGGAEKYSELSEEEKEIESSKILSEDKAISKALADAQNGQNEVGMELLYSFLERLPQAEKEVYKCLAKIYKTSEKNIKESGLDKTIERVKEIATSETFMAFFNLAMKLKQ